MSSLLSFQLEQQQLAQKQHNNNSLPSPPHSFCEDEADAIKATEQPNDALQTVFKDMTLKEYPASMPENFTIDHSLRKHSPIITAAATGGLTIRRRQSDYKRSLLSESLNAIYRCHDCGKSYKHPNCLQKHKWEHSEEWELTSKLPLTKHQQVQMLEAAAILISMDCKPSPSIEEEEDDDDDESIIIDDDDRRSTCSSEIFMEDL
ncbi:hypothetical protein K501DRAFT_283384 [Backusella circina FSU 941]|nr:hypothetical protein K501DRAFT_283384 [Backusella circina FSU 941]